MSALDKQVAGNHYKDQKIQPIQLAYMLGQTPAFCKVAKYCTRIKDNPVQQLNKALHCIELEQELKEYVHQYSRIPYHIAEDIICEFTGNTLLQAVLLFMHSEDYTSAIHYMYEMIILEERKSNADKQD